MFASYNAYGSERGLIWIETVSRRGIPLVDIVGLPGSAIKEARDRIRAAAAAAGIEFPKGHILINLAPAGIPKTRACLDLALGLSILSPPEGHSRGHILVMGELTLAGKVRPVEGVLSALMEARAQGVEACILPAGNFEEAKALPLACTMLVSDLAGALEAVFSILAGSDGRNEETGVGEAQDGNVGKGRQIGQSGMLEQIGKTDQQEKVEPEIRFLGGEAILPMSKTPDVPAVRMTGDQHRFSLDVLTAQPGLMLGVLAAAAGAHHALMYGPPGCGKTMATEFLSALIPDLDKDEFLEVNRMYSLAGLSVRDGKLLARGPVRRPHHSSSAESVLGSRNGLPGEISLAHRGFLVLDECPEFRRGLLQTLREPMDEGEIRLGRVDHHVRLPATFALVMTMNSCPCGSLGSRKGTCMCSPLEVQRYWSRLGSPVLDRVDIRVVVAPEMEAHGSLRLPTGVHGKSREFLVRQTGLVQDFVSRTCAPTLEGLIRQVSGCRHTQYERHERSGWGSLVRNGDLRGKQLQEAEKSIQPCNGETGEMMGRVMDWKNRTSLRAWHGLLRLARTFADLENAEGISLSNLLLAMEFRQTIEPAPGLTIHE